MPASDNQTVEEMGDPDSQYQTPRAGESKSRHSPFHELPARLVRTIPESFDCTLRVEILQIGMSS